MKEMNPVRGLGAELLGDAESLPERDSLLTSEALMLPASYIPAQRLEPGV